MRKNLHCSQTIFTLNCFVQIFNKGDQISSKKKKFITIFKFDHNFHILTNYAGRVFLACLQVIWASRPVFYILKSH